MLTKKELVFPELAELFGQVAFSVQSDAPDDPGDGRALLYLGADGALRLRTSGGSAALGLTAAERTAIDAAVSVVSDVETLETTVAEHALSISGLSESYGTLRDDYDSLSLVISSEIRPAIDQNGTAIDGLGLRITALEEVPGSPFRGVYSASSAYAEGDVVICDGSLWECGMDVAAGEDYPEDASAVWSCVLAGNLLRGDYDATISYANGDFVTYSGSLWKSEMDDNRGWYPSTDGLEWTLVFRGSRLTGDYAAGTTYAAGDYVVSGGALWKCESDNPTEAPSADSAEWSLAVGGGSSGGGTAALSLAMTPAVMDTTYYIVGYLDSDCPTLTGATRVHGITKLHIWCVAANPDSSGNLELEVSCGSVSDTVELPVTGTETMQTIELSAAATGTLTLTRTIGGAMETFPADVTAIVTGVLYE